MKDVNDTNEYYTREDVSNSEIQLKVTLPADAFTKSYNELLKDRIKNTNIKGFRKGEAPKELLEGELKPGLLAETFERIAPYYVNGAIIKEGIQPISPPSYTDLEKLDVDIPVVFTVKITVMPQFKLGNMKKVKVEDEDVKATKEEIDNTIKTMMENNVSTIKEKEVNDKWAKEIGEFYQFDDVKTLKDLEKVVSETIEQQKKGLVEQTKVTDAVRQAVELSKIEIPQAAIDYEAEQREEAFLNDLKGIGTTVEEFSKKQGVEMADMKDKWSRDAKDALEHDVLFRIYAIDQNLEVSEKELTDEINKIRESAKQRDGDKYDDTGYDDPNWREHIKGFMLKQKAYDHFIHEVVGIHHDHDHDEEESKDKKDTSAKDSSKKEKK
jgi:trigger factor